MLSQADGRTLSVSLIRSEAPVVEASDSTWLDWLAGLGLFGLAAAFPLMLIVRRR